MPRLSLTKSHRPTLRLSVMSRALGAAGGYNPATAFFSSGEPGVLYDNNDLSTFFLDTNAATPATVNGLVGVQLDGRFGYAKTKTTVPELSLDEGNGAVTISQDGNVLTFTGAATGDGKRNDTFFTLNRRAYCRVTVTGTGAVLVYAGNGGPLNLTVSGGTTVGATGRYAATASYLIVRAGTGGFTGTVTIDEVFEQDGRHRAQTTTASKPVLRGTPTGANLAPGGGTFDSADGWTLGGGQTISGGKLNLASATGNTNTEISPTIGRVYRIEIDVEALSAGTVQVSFGGIAQTISAAGRYTIYGTASGITTFRLNYVTTTGTVDNITIYDVSADAVTAPYALQYDGVDDFMQTAAVDFTAYDKVFSCWGVRKLSDAAAGTVFEIGGGGVAQAFWLRAPNTAAPDFSFSSRGSAAASIATVSGFQASVSGVLSAEGSISGDVSRLRVNGGAPTTNTADQGTGNYLNGVVYFGRRAGVNTPLNGLDYGGLIAGVTALPDADAIEAQEGWQADRTPDVILA